MPSTGPITTTPTLDIVTNRNLIQNPSSSHILSGQFAKDGANAHGGTQIAFSIPPNNLAVLISHSLKEAFMSGDCGHEPVSYLSRGEVQGDIDAPEAIKASMNSGFRVLRIMPVLTIQQDGRELMHLTLRGQGASDAGNWSCASSLVNSAVDTTTIFATLNRETGLLVDGKIAIFAPIVADDSNSSKILVAANSMKECLSKRVPELSAAYERNAERMWIPTKMALPKKADTVTFYNAVDSEIKCVVSDNPEQRTLTLIFPLVAELPKGAVLTAFNGQGYEGPAALVDTKFLAKQKGLPLIPGLRELVNDK